MKSKINKNYPPATKLQYTILAWLLAWPIVAIYADGWHHHHLHIGSESLFNLFHLFLYLGVTACGLFLTLIAYQNLRRGYSWDKCLPHSFIRAVWGIGFFVAGIAGDLLWHTVFGFEESVDALFSPPHLLLALGGMLVVTCLLRPIWHRDREKLVNPIVPVLGFTYFYLIFIFFLQYAHPYYALWLSDGVPVVGGVSYIQAAALSGGIVRTLVFCAMLFSTIKFFRFPKGSLFLIVITEAIGMGFMGGQFQYVISAIIAGVLTEIVYHGFHDDLHHHARLRVFGFLVPVMFFVPYVFLSLIHNPSWWSIHMIAGMIIINGIAGWLLTYLIYPPKVDVFPTRFGDGN